VILDSHLAAIYGVSTGRFNEAVKRNVERFSEDFMLRLSAREYAALLSQIATSKPGRGGRRMRQRLDLLTPGYGYSPIPLGAID
jgi:hypothetical protein